MKKHINKLESAEAEQEIIRSIVRNGIYMCMHYKESKQIFDMVGMDRLMEGTVCVCDVSEKPISFVVEIMGTTDYVYYNARFFRVRYVCENLAALERAAMDMEAMKSRLDLELHRSMEDMAKDLKKSIMYKINFGVSHS